MTIASKKRKLSDLVSEVSTTHQPLLIQGAIHNAVLISEHDWRAMEETLFLLSVPGMRESIRKGLKKPAKQCLKTLRW